MKQSEFHTKLAAAWKLAEDSGCYKVAKYCGELIDIDLEMPLHKSGRIEFALAVVEGKAVFDGDELYYSGAGLQAFTVFKMCPEKWSWNPPKPKTVMVELLVEDAKYWAACSDKKLQEVTQYDTASNNFYDAIRAALAKEEN